MGGRLVGSDCSKNPRGANRHNDGPDRQYTGLTTTIRDWGGPLTPQDKEDRDDHGRCWLDDEHR
jgi:hypothetical protein